MGHENMSRDDSRESKPSLFANSALPRDEADKLRMLDGLSVPAARNSKGARNNAGLLAVVMAVGVALIGASTWTLWTRQAGHETPVVVARSSVAKPADIAPRAAPASDPSTMVESRQEVASIETVTAPAPRANSGPLAAAASDKHEPAPPSASSAAALSAPARTDGQQLAQVTLSAPKRAQKSASAPPPRRSTSPAGQRDDADVDLLAALMSHVQGDHAAGTHSKSQNRLESQTIAQLVQRCQRLEGGKETQCRREICEGSWGKADACPMRLAPLR